MKFRMKSLLSLSLYLRHFYTETTIVERRVPPAVPSARWLYIRIYGYSAAVSVA